MSFQFWRSRVVLLLCVLALTSSIAQSADGPAARPMPTARVAGEVVDLTNAQRTRNGRSRLHANARLMHAAQLQAEQMARVGKMAHVLPNAPYPSAKDRLAAADYHWQSYGENVALGQVSAAAAIDSWMHSSGHRKNMLSPDFTELGAGYATDRKGRPYYVQVFGKPQE